MQFPRFLKPRLEAALGDTPVVLIHGPRQCGKSTLARHIADERGYKYLTFDDPVVLASAKEDPTGFCLGLPECVVLDEIQRAPELFAVIKLAVDRHRTPGRFLLTGSANVMLQPALSDSLAGRIEVLRLGPLTQVEMQGNLAPTRLIDRLFAADFSGSRNETPTTLDVGAVKVDLDDSSVDSRLTKRSMEARVIEGGFPAAIARPSAVRRQRWLTDYTDAFIERDIRDIARISMPELLPRLLQAAAINTARLFNGSDLASPFELSRPTIRDYLYHLERLFLIDMLPPWHSNRLSRMVKTPKIHLTDTGLIAAITGATTETLASDRMWFGQLLETFVYLELQRQAGWLENRHAFFHYRDKDKCKVDVVIERDARQVCGIEVKASHTVRATDFKGLKRLQEGSAERFRCGVVLYSGDVVLPFGDGLFAVPLELLWR